MAGGTMSDPLADITIEELSGDVIPMHEPPPSTAVVRRERRSEVIRPLDADQLVESFEQYQALLPKLLDASDYQAAGRGKRFVKKSGWRKIATAFDLDVQIIRSLVERDENGQPCRAEVWARAIAPSGRSMDGDGYCSVDEERFSGPRGNRSKLENDLRATATTRAMNRAISGLVGMGEVSAEEVSGGNHDTTEIPVPPWALEASIEAKRAATVALHALVGDETTAAKCWEQIMRRMGGGMPAAVTYALIAAHRHAQTVDASGEAPTDPASATAPDASQEPLL
jgi:hypothetical protein